MWLSSRQRLPLGSETSFMIRVTKPCERLGTLLGFSRQRWCRRPCSDSGFVLFNRPRVGPRGTSCTSSRGRTRRCRCGRPWVRRGQDAFDVAHVLGLVGLDADRDIGSSTASSEGGNAGPLQLPRLISAVCPLQKRTRMVDPTLLHARLTRRNVQVLIRTRVSLSWSRRGRPPCPVN